ncbi:ATP-binding SpoIIE family protein phosphatase [Natranaerofaba carboxydovora]|uniref:ATP-binding SpoIIE family protein phosphatase n=1 Tax=Natranaerofaba carboxydovora TaxID=2742683 RepID=UPI001F130471|nr:SpoIIE family protein phosphatase [Natranaerofaba carboxydovora]UMZ74488.1 Phosphoserine phosphatase RsbU [Natranaerofaba carboxydovora]
MRLLLFEKNLDVYSRLYEYLKAGLGKEELIIDRVFNYGDTKIKLKHNYYDMVFVCEKTLDMLDENFALKVCNIGDNINLPVIIIYEEVNFEDKLSLIKRKPSLCCYMAKDELSPNIIRCCMEYMFETKNERKRRIEAEEKLSRLDQKINRTLKENNVLSKQMSNVNHPEINGLTFSSWYKPAENLKGNYCDIQKIGGRIFYFFADVSTQDYESLILNIFIKNSINNFFLENFGSLNINPKDILYYLTEKFLEANFPSDYLICIYIGVLDLETNVFEYSNAGFYLPPLLSRWDGEIQELECQGLPVSSSIDKKLFEFDNKTCKINKGDTLLFYTKGLLNTRVRNRIYGLKRLEKIYYKHHRYDPNVITELIKRDHKKFLGISPKEDDIIVLALQMDPNELIEKNFTINSTFDEIHIAKKNIYHYLIDNYKDELDVDKVMLGVNEMLNNSLEHGNKHDDSKKIHIMFKKTSDYIKVCIQDEGEGFDWNSRIEKNLNTNDFSDEGRGLIIAKCCFDYVFYNSRGNRVNMIKSI